MALLDLLGRRWTLRIVWELRDRAASFRELQQRCDGMSASVLNQRLGELRDAGIVASGEGGFALTAEGRELLDAFPPIHAWAQRWAQRVTHRSRRSEGTELKSAGPAADGRAR